MYCINSRVRCSISCCLCCSQDQVWHIKHLSCRHVNFQKSNGLTKYLSDYLLKAFFALHFKIHNPCKLTIIIRLAGISAGSFIRLFSFLDSPVRRVLTQDRLPFLSAGEAFVPCITLVSVCKNRWINIDVEIFLSFSPYLHSPIIPLLIYSLLVYFYWKNSPKGGGISN